MKAGPFRVRCLLCGTVAESWHYSAKAQAPKGATFGMASCKCENVRCDSIGGVDSGWVQDRTIGCGIRN
jgi:hypothetical protein